MNKEEFMTRMSKLYDNYSKVVAKIGEQKVLDCGWFVANRKDYKNCTEYQQKRFDNAWYDFVSVVKDLDNEEFSDLIHFIADNKYKINEFIADCIN